MMYTSFLTSSEDDRRQVRGRHHHQQQQSFFPGSNVSDEESQWDLEGMPMTRRKMDAGTPSYLLSIQEEEDLSLSLYDSQQHTVGAGTAGGASYYESSFVGDGRRGRRRKPNLQPKGAFRVSSMTVTPSFFLVIVRCRRYLYVDYVLSFCRLHFTQLGFYVM